jgi:hypothetical protein
MPIISDRQKINMSVKGDPVPVKGVPISQLIEAICPLMETQLVINVHYSKSV